MFARVKVPPELNGQRLDAVLEQLLDGVSRSQAQKLVRRGAVKVGGKRVVRSNGKVTRGQTIEVELPEDAPTGTVRVIHEDELLIVVDKPAGWLTHEADRSKARDVASTLDASHGPLALARGTHRPGVVHRLDRETSGVMVFARTDDALHALQDQFRAKTTRKEYEALVHGSPKEDRFEVDARIGPVPGKQDRQGVDERGGKDATTGVEVVERFGSHALVACMPATGRRHQIRVHLAFVGHAVVGDPLYGTKSRRESPALASAPLCLHARRLTFAHPGSGERVTFEAARPRAFETVIEALRR